MWDSNNIPICDDDSMNDPNTGWGGFTDHRAKKHFENKAEQDAWYKDRQKNHLPNRRSSWTDDE